MKHGLSNKEVKEKESARNRGSSTAPGAVSVVPSERNDLSQFEQDLFTKERNGTVNSTSRPGAYDASPLDEATKDVGQSIGGLNQFEQDVVSKERNSMVDKTSQPGAYQANHPVDVKNDAVQTMVQPGAHASDGRSALGELENAVALKQGMLGGSIVGAHHQMADIDTPKSLGTPSPGAAHRDLSELEDSVANKMRVRRNSTSDSEQQETAPTSRSELNGLESVVAAKSHLSNQTPMELGSLERDIAAKTRLTVGRRHGEVVLLESQISQGQADADADKDVNASFKLGKEISEQALYGRGFSHGSSLNNLEGGLAVAEPVTEEDEPYLPSAVEFDPDAKPTVFKSKRYRLYAAVAVVFVIVAAVGVGIGVSLGGADEEPDPSTVDPDEDPRVAEIHSLVVGVIGEEPLLDPSGYYSRALEWITYEDPLNLAPASATLFQRFIMAYFYFATTVDGDYLDCSPGPEDFCSFQSRNREGVTFETYEQNWLSGTSECDWAGIRCNGLGSVIEIAVAGNGLSSKSFPAGILFLPFLALLNLHSNTIRGSIPLSIGSLKHLSVVSLKDCSLSGPMNFWSLRNPLDIRLGQNMLTGSIPPEIQKWTDIKALELDTNQIIGSPPEEMAACSHLDELELHDNALTGTFPKVLTSARRLRVLTLGGNAFTGTIPLEFGDLTYMKNLHLNDNVGLNGELPTTLYGLTDLTRLEIHNCNFTGRISSEIGEMSNLIALTVSDNRFTGPIPSEIGSMIALRTLWTSGNDFTGSMPSEICLLRSESLFNDLSADCLQDQNGFVELPCLDGCCTTCCQPDGGSCLAQR